MSINPPYRFDPLQNLVDIKSGELPDEDCSSGGAVGMGVTHSFGTLYWDGRGQVGYCMLVHPGLNPSGVAFELRASLDPDIAGSTAWRIEQTYGSDPGGQGALAIYTELVGAATEYLDSLPGNTEGLADFGPFGQGSELQQTCCNFSGYPVTCYPAGELGNNPEATDTDVDYQADICPTA